MSWKKHFTRYDGDARAGQTKANRWQSWLPEVYSGMPNRTERYVCLLYTSPSPRD